MYARCSIVALCCLYSMNAACLQTGAPHGVCVVYSTHILYILHSFHVQSLKKYFCCYFFGFGSALGGPVIKWNSLEGSANKKWRNQEFCLHRWLTHLRGTYNYVHFFAQVSSCFFTFFCLSIWNPLIHVCLFEYCDHFSACLWSVLKTNQKNLFSACSDCIKIRDYCR